jgi:carbonic anhydrase/acetyltransferase-like protein (isoleucine patch superfamily)
LFDPIAGKGEIMRKPLVFLCPLLLVFGILASGGAVVIDFEDITTDDTAWVPYTEEYKGFTWHTCDDPPLYMPPFYWAVVSDLVYQGDPFFNTYGSPSGEYAAFNNAGRANLSLSSRTDFYYIGAHLASWAVDDNSAGMSVTTMRIEGWNDGINVWNSEYSLSPDRYDWLAAGSLSSIAVDELRFIGPYSGHYWLMDNFTYSTTPPAPIDCPNDPDNDIDGDGVCGDVDNCPTVRNSDQIDKNNDGFGDVCVSPDANIADDADLGYGVIIFENTTINSGAAIGDNAVIKNGVTIGVNASVGSNTSIGEGSWVKQNASVGSDVTVDSNATIGVSAIVGDGTSMGEDTWVKRNASVGDDVMLGSSVMVGKAVTIRDRVSIDDRTTILRRTRIGSDTAIGQDCDISRSVKIGRRVFIGNFVTILYGAWIPRDTVVPDHSIVQ